MSKVTNAAWECHRIMLFEHKGCDDESISAMCAAIEAKTHFSRIVKEHDDAIAALKMYGRHAPDCRQETQCDENEECTCNFEKALKIGTSESAKGKHPIGTRIEFLEDLMCPAIEDKYAWKGELGHIVDYSDREEQEYIVRVNGRDDPFGVSDKEFSVYKPNSVRSSD